MAMLVGALVLIPAGVTVVLVRGEVARTGSAPHSSVPSPEDTPTVAPTTTTPPRPRIGPQDTVNAAVTVGQSRGARVAVAVYDRQTGTVYAGGEADSSYPSASLVKAFIATRLLVDGEAKDPATKDLMWKMITLSDDGIATQLYPVAGGQNLIDWIVRRYKVTGLKPTTRSGAWGLTQVTARGMVTFFAAAAKDPLVGPWLLDAMANTQAKGSDGWPQWFGIPQATQGWRIKQGWLCCVDNKSRLHSTGFVNGDRFTVAILTEDDKSTYGDVGMATVTLMAQALMPGGSIPGSGRA
jgi:hypothetical protein